MTIKIGTLVRVTDVVHGDHEPHDQARHHDACKYVGAEMYVADIERAEADNGYGIAYLLDGAGEQEFYGDELEVIG